MTKPTGVKDFQAHELTIAEMRELLALSESMDDDPCQDLLEEITLSEVAAMLSVEVSALDELTAAELVKCVKACRELNSVFFDRKRRAMEQQKQMLALPSVQEAMAAKAAELMKESEISKNQPQH